MNSINMDDDVLISYALSTFLCLNVLRVKSEINGHREWCKMRYTEKQKRLIMKVSEIMFIN